MKQGFNHRDFGSTGKEIMIRESKLQSRVFLFARPSFLTGIARIADPFGTLNTYNTSPSGIVADYRALYSDWATVGDDLRAAIELYKEQIRKQP